ncbi:MAG: response regulator [Chloroflexi bacterium]|nr:response regulator [Chloroflexota bacterium]
MNILVIEDEPSSLKLAHVVMAAEGNQVRDADTALKGLDQIAREKPDVILLDLALPDKDGLTLARQIKSNPATQDIFIVAITAYPDRFKREDALAAGCDAYVVKPISTRELPGAIDELFHRKSK